MEIIEGSDGVFPFLLFFVSLTFVSFLSLSFARRENDGRLREEEK